MKKLLTVFVLALVFLALMPSCKSQENKLYLTIEQKVK